MAFWILAPIMVVAALGILFVRKAVHAALLLAVVMISLAVLYAVLDAPFLFAVQIIVYTGAILMLFLFVLMLVGVDASDSVVETIRGPAADGRARRAAARRRCWCIALEPGHPRHRRRPRRRQRRAATSRRWPTSLFSKYVFAFEVTSALLITAALGAMVLAHRERLTPKPGQADQAAQRMRDYAESGKHPGPLPAPGVFARHNAVDTPALLPDGTRRRVVGLARARGPRHRALGARRWPTTSRRSSASSASRSPTTPSPAAGEARLQHDRATEEDDA